MHMYTSRYLSDSYGHWWLEEVKPHMKSLFIKCNDKKMQVNSQGLFHSTSVFYLIWQLLQIKSFAQLINTVNYLLSQCFNNVYTNKNFIEAVYMWNCVNPPASPLLISCQLGTKVKESVRLQTASHEQCKSRHVNANLTLTSTASQIHL